MDRLRPPGRPGAQMVKLDISWWAILRLLLVGAGLWLLLQLWEIVLVVIVALVLDGTFSPIVDWLERRGVRRGAAITGIITLLVLLIIGIGFLVIPAIFGQVNQVLTNAPFIQAAVADLLAPFPSLQRWRAMIAEASPDDYLAPISNYALAYAQAAVEVVAYAVSSVFLAFYILADRERVTGYLYSLVPRRFHLRMARIMLDMETVVGGYMRGQALTSLAMFAFSYLLLTLLGAPNAFAIAVFAAFADLIPFVGTLLATIPIVISALSVSPVAAAVALGASLLYDQIEGRLLIPRVYGATMRLSPVIVLLALLVGGALLGIVGALLALPIAAGIRVIIEDLRIELPGEQPDEGKERIVDEQVEATFAERANGASAEESAVIATEMAERLEEIEQDVERQVMGEAADEERLPRAG